MPNFDWNQFPKADSNPTTPQKGGGSPSPKQGGFDWNQFPVAGSQGPSEAESFIRQTASGAAAGFDDEFSGVVGAAGRVFGIKNLGSWKPFDKESKLETTEEPLSADEIVKAYRQNRDDIRAQQKEDVETNPNASLAGNLVGAVISPTSKIGMGAKGLKGAVKAGITQGGLYGAGMSDADLTQGEVGKFAKDTIENAALGGVVPVAFRATGYGLKKAGQAANWTSKKLFSSVFGVNEKNISKYLNRREAINLAPELSQIKTEVDDAVFQLSKEVDAGKLKVSEAKDALKELKSQVRNNLADAKMDAREALRKTDQLFKEAAANAIEPIKNVKAPTQLANEIIGSIDDLKTQVINKSNEAKYVLGQGNKKIDITPVLSRIEGEVEKLKGYKTPEAESIIKRLNDYGKELVKEAQTNSKQYSQIPLESAKKRIQGLDQITQYNPMAGSFDQAQNKSLKGIRNALDDTLKSSVPEYSEAMKPVAKDSALLNELSSSFGDERKAIGRLNQIAGPKGRVDLESLKALEKATGKEGQFTNKINEYIRSQKLLKDPKALDELKRSLPEYQNYRNAMAKLAKMKPNWSRDQLEAALSRSKEARALSQAENYLVQAERRYSPVSKLTPSSTEPKLKSFLKPAGATIETQKAVNELERITGKKFTQSLEDRAVLDSFMKGNTNGSRNTLLWTMVGLATGGIPGALGGQHLAIASWTNMGQGLERRF